MYFLVEFHPSRFLTWTNNRGGGERGHSLLFDSPARAMNIWTKKSDEKEEQWRLFQRQKLESAFKISPFSLELCRRDVNTIAKETPKLKPGIIFVSTTKISENTNTIGKSAVFPGKCCYFYSLETVFPALKLTSNFYIIKAISYSWKSVI